MEDTYPMQYRYRRIVLAKLFIDKHYANTIDVDRIASEAALSKFHFIRLFRKSYGYTPVQYLARVRVRQGRILLAQGLPVIQACQAVGYNSVTTFSLLFRRIVGRSPAAWQCMELVHQRVSLEKPWAQVPRCFAERFFQSRNSG